MMMWVIPLVNSELDWGSFLLSLLTDTFNLLANLQSVPYQHARHSLVEKILASDDR
jgi:hypothetical protein